MAVYVALRDALERVLGQIPERERRNSLTLQLIHSILLLPAFDLPENELHRDLSSIAAITDVERRHSEILTEMRLLATLGVPKRERPEGIRDLSSLRGCLHRYSEASDEVLLSVIYSYLLMTAGVLKEFYRPEDWPGLIFFFLQTLTSMPQLEQLRTDKLKDVLRTALERPDEKFCEPMHPAAPV